MKMLNKRYFLPAALSVLLAALLVSSAGCAKVSHNGDLDGMWRIVSIENLKDGTVSQPYNLFYCFFLHTANLTRGYIVATANMKYGYPYLILDFPYQEPGSLLEWGIANDYVEFEILQLSGSSLIMKSDDFLIELQRF